MLLTEEIRNTQVLVEKMLSSFFKKKEITARTIDPLCVPLVEQIADLTLRPSKRIRPLLVKLGYKTQGTENESEGIVKNLFTTMMAVELFHSFALIHDDIMDEDVERRGGPTIHEFFKSKIKGSFEKIKDKQRSKAVNPVRYGESMAILAGDLALVWADECMQNTQNEEAIRLFCKMKEEVAFGQALDAMKQNGYIKIPQDKINELKTAWYSMVRPLQIGAALAGASGKTATILAQFGVPVGKLFQLKDDLMDKEITEIEFNQQILPLQKEAKTALDPLNAPLETKTALANLIRFVIERST